MPVEYPAKGEAGVERGEGAMKCKDINQLLIAYLDNEVNPEERRQIEAHLPACQKCQEELQQITSTRDVVRQAFKAKVSEVEPSIQAWDRVKECVEVKNPFWQQFNGILSKPQWRVALPLVLVLIVIGALWGTGILPGSPSNKVLIPVPTSTTPTIVAPSPSVPAPIAAATPTPTLAGRPAPPSPFEFHTSPEESYYSPGEAVEVKLLITNVSSAPIKLDPYPPEIKVVPRLDSNPDNLAKVLFSVAAGMQTFEIKPQETVSINFTWDQKDNLGKQVVPGWYDVIYYDFSISGGVSPFDSGAQIPLAKAHVLVQNPQGVLEKTLEPNQSKTVNETTLTLQRVELSAKGMNIYVLHSPPDYSPNSSAVYERGALAEYSLDGGRVKPVQNFEIGYRKNGIILIWANLDPVPMSAKELTFRITSLRRPPDIGTWMGPGVGPWEFKVPLQ